MSPFVGTSSTVSGVMQSYRGPILSSIAVSASPTTNGFVACHAANVPLRPAPVLAKRSFDSSLPEGLVANKNTSEVVRAGLRLLEEHETKYAALRAAIEEGVVSGEPQKLDLNAFLTRRRSERRVRKTP